MPSQRSQTQKDDILYNFIYIKCPEETNGSGKEHLGNVEFLLRVIKTF